MKSIFRRSIIIISSLVLTGWSLIGQQLHVIDLGAIEGELRQIERSVLWVNADTVISEIHLNYASQEFNLPEETYALQPADSLVIPVKITIPDRHGDYEFELQLVSQSKDLLVGYVFKFKVLEAEEDVFEAYRNAYWPLRAKENVFNVRSSFIGDTLKASFDVYNFSGKALSFANLKTEPYYALTFQPDTIGHNEFSQMTIKVLSATLEAGFTKERLDFYSENQLAGSIPIQYTLVPKPNEASIDAPRISISRSSHDFKVIKVGDEVTTSFLLRNRGAASLELTKIESNCSCLRFDIPKRQLAIGEEVEMKVVFDAKNRIGLERKTLAIFSNDPENPTRVLTIRAHVK